MQLPPTFKIVARDMAAPAYRERLTFAVLSVFVMIGLALLAGYWKCLEPRYAVGLLSAFIFALLIQGCVAAAECWDERNV